VPTYERRERFTREWRRLAPEQQIAFLRAVEHFVQDLRRGQFRKGLRVKAVQGRRGWWEMTWAPNGRALFTYGPEVHPGEQHIIWQRIGGHEIFE
jgi:hypothetical protein